MGDSGGGPGGARHQQGGDAEQDDRDGLNRQMEKTTSTNPITTGPISWNRPALMDRAGPKSSSAVQPRQLSQAVMAAMTTVGRYSRLLTRADISPGTVPLPDSVAVLTPRFLPQLSVPVAGRARIPGAHVLVNVPEPARVHGRAWPGAS